MYLETTRLLKISLKLLFLSTTDDADRTSWLLETALQVSKPPLRAMLPIQPSGPTTASGTRPNPTPTLADTTVKLALAKMAQALQMPRLLSTEQSAAVTTTSPDSTALGTTSTTAFTIKN